MYANEKLRAEKEEKRKGIQTLKNVSTIHVFNDFWRTQKSQ